PRLDPAGGGFGGNHRLGGDEPAHHRSAAAARPAGPGHVSGRLAHPAHLRSDHYRHADLRHAAGSRRSQDSPAMTDTTQLPETDPAALNPQSAEMAVAGQWKLFWLKFVKHRI